MASCWHVSVVVATGQPFSVSLLRVGYILQSGVPGCLWLYDLQGPISTADKQGQPGITLILVTEKKS